VSQLTSRVVDLPEPEFRRLIDQDTRGKAPTRVSAELRQPECVPRWYQTLIGMQKSVEGQLAAKAAESRAAQADYRAQLEHTSDRSIRVERLKRESRDESWRAGALRFKSGLEERIIEARQILREMEDPLVAVSDRIVEDRNRALTRVAALEAAIRRHHAEFPPDDEPSEADIELWQTVT
jgi:hypothetical protein